MEFSYASLPRYCIDSYQHSEGKLRFLAWEGPTTLASALEVIVG